VPSTWYPRTFEEILRDPPASLRLFPVWLLLGPRRWERGQVVSLAAAAARDLTEAWRVVPPWVLALS